ncbi:MAG: hypothetical protein BYD32DRAFT_459045 [Podila humilis]|nr:MAG: hypothetical protein BYD32DRAFT_459045 [Podila humilis]
MFEVPEMDHMVCVQLSTLDLFQCSQVCSAWYDVVMPYLWATIPLLKNRQQQESLRRLPTLLEEYGHLVNTIPKFDTFVQALNISSGEQSRRFLRISSSLLEQFFKRCPNII